MGDEERYDKVNVNTKPHLVYGTKMRYAKCLVSNAHSAQRIYPDTFLPHELELIQEISDNAIARANKAREEELRKINTTVTASEVGSGSETQHREYNGK